MLLPGRHSDRMILGRARADWRHRGLDHGLREQPHGQARSGMEASLPGSVSSWHGRPLTNKLVSQIRNQNHGLANNLIRGESTNLFPCSPYIGIGMYVPSWKKGRQGVRRALVGKFGDEKVALGA